jgi:hypothetical protein
MTKFAQQCFLLTASLLLVTAAGASDLNQAGQAPAQTAKAGQGATAKQAPADAPDPDEQAIRAYVLTMEKVQKYVDASGRLRDGATKDPTLSEELNRISDYEGTDKERIALIASSPHVYPVLKSTGITARDFVMIPTAIMTAGFAVQAQEQGQPTPPFVNPANIKFVRAHKKDLQEMGFMESPEEEKKDDTQ